MKSTRTDEDRQAAVEYGRKLRAARAQWGIPLLSIAAAARVSVTSIRNWERGDCLPEFLAAKRVQRYIREARRTALRGQAVQLLEAEAHGGHPPCTKRISAPPEGMA